MSHFHSKNLLFTGHSNYRPNHYNCMFNNTSIRVSALFSKKKKERKKTSLESFDKALCLRRDMTKITLFLGLFNRVVYHSAAGLCRVNDKIGPRGKRNCTINEILY